MLGITRRWIAAGEPWIWLNAAAVGLSVIAVSGLLLLIAVRGFGHFWPDDVLQFRYAASGQQAVTVAGERVDVEYVPVLQYEEAGGVSAPPGADVLERWLIKTGNRRTEAPDFSWYYTHSMSDVTRPADLVVLERLEWGHAYGRLVEVREAGTAVASGEDAWAELRLRLARAVALRDERTGIERGELRQINYRLEQLRLAELERNHQGVEPTVSEAATEAAERAALEASFRAAERRLIELQAALERDVVLIETAAGRRLTQPLSGIVRVWRPNAMSLWDKLGHYRSSLWMFLADEPREANTEGGIFPAIFGTVLMVMLMSILVTPFGVVAAIYLREYARQGPLVQLTRIAVNNLAGVPSIVYGVFGLGFFVYFLGGSIDQLLFAESLPAPTFGTPGLLWASLTLALLTLPVVVVSTEEGLARIPRSVREGSLALGATQAETLFRVVLPMASPSILTGVILAVARAAGEVAPLMLVGVVKLAPALPMDGNFPFIHLERKFMHLGFHIYDVGFQSPNVEAARPLVYATALLLVTIIVTLNLTAILLRSRLERRYRGVEA